MPVEGAPLIYSTAFARNMAVTLTPANGQPIEVPVRARADRGGYMLAEPLPAGLSGKASARLHGQWGFESFEGPSFTFHSRRAATGTRVMRTRARWSAATMPSN